jgi:hypothetical protein
LPPTNPAQANAVAVVVKIDNIDDARPQTGLNGADVVYEELVEGGLTRLAAVYQAYYPSVVGPVRSGRLTDIPIVDNLNHPVFAYAGTNGLFLPQLRAQPITDVDIGNHPELFNRVNYAAAPHNLYTDVAQLAAQSPPGSGPPSPLFTYRPAGQAVAGAGAAPASEVTIGFPAASVAWYWSASSGQWLRSQNGTADVERSGDRLSAANVIIQFVGYVDDGLATGEGLPPAPIPKGELVGSGQAWILTDGAIIKGTWQRTSLTGPTTWTDMGGNPIALTPGRTWVELAPNGTVPTVSG